MKYIKRILLIFVILSVGYLISNEFIGPFTNKDVKTKNIQAENESQIQDGFIVYYFHGNRRCPTCNAIEKYTLEALENNFLDKINNDELIWETVNIEESGKEHFINDFQLRNSGPVIVQYKDGNVVKWKSLDKVWQLVRDKNEFTIYVNTEVEGFIK